MLFAREAGFNRAAIADPRLLTPWAQRRMDPPESWWRTSSVLVCCLSCLRIEPDDLSVPGDPHALVAPFARAHYYRAAIVLLRSVAARMERELGIPRKSIRLFSNSRLPEKPLLVASGLGAYGRNGCTLVPGLGSLFVIAGAVIPVATVRGAEAAAPLPDPCGGCDRCRRACPAAAIEEPFRVRAELCLQGRAAVPEVLSPETMERWAARLYGCQECQSVCPHNRGLTERASAAQGELGPSISIRELLRSSAPELRQRFRGTALGMSWISEEALLRNALVAAGNRGEPSLRDEVESHARSDSPLIRRTACWARERLS